MIVMTIFTIKNKMVQFMVSFIKFFDKLIHLLELDWMIKYMLGTYLYRDEE